MKRNIKEKQYEEIYSRYVKDVYKTCVYYLHDEEKAKEVVEEVFKRLYEHLEEVNPNYILGYLVHEVKTIIQSNQGENLISEGVIE